MKRLNKKRTLTTVLIILGIVFIISLFGNKASLSYGEEQYKTIYTSNGDTLWSIAEYQSENNPYYLKKDIRYIIYDIKKANSIIDCSLQIGQKLLIPQY